MEWRSLDGNTTYAHSAENRLQYLVVRDDASLTVRLCRVPETLPLHEPMAEAREALRTEVVLVALRGPGRPPGAPEMAELVTRAQRYAERYDAGEDLLFGGWQHATELARAVGQPGPDRQQAKHAPDWLHDPYAGHGPRRMEGL